MPRSHVQPSFEYEFDNVDDLRRMVQQDVYFYDQGLKPGVVPRDVFSTLYFMWNRTRYILLALIDRRFDITPTEMAAVDTHMCYLTKLFEYYIEITGENDIDAAISARAVAVSESASFEARWTTTKFNGDADSVVAFVLAAIRARDHVLHAVFQDSLDQGKIQMSPEVFCDKLGSKSPLGDVLVVIYTLSRRYLGFGQFFPLVRGSLSVDQCLAWARNILFPTIKKCLAKKRMKKLVQKKNSEFLGPIQMFGLQSFD